MTQIGITLIGMGGVLALLGLNGWVLDRQRRRLRVESKGSISNLGEDSSRGTRISMPIYGRAGAAAYAFRNWQLVTILGSILGLVGVLLVVA